MNIAEARDDLRGHAVGLPQQGGQQVIRFNLRMVILAREALRVQHGLLGFLRKLIQVHNTPPKYVLC